MLLPIEGCAVLYKRQISGIQMMVADQEKAALYARVSTKNQTLDTQKKKLKEWAEEEGIKYDLYSEKASSVKERPKFEEIMENLDSYDIIVTTKLDRFARSVIDFHKRMEVLKENEVDFKAIDQPNFDTTSPNSEFMMNILVAFAEFERKMIRQRMDEGFRKAQEEGRVGRDPKLGKSGREWAAKKYREDNSITTVQALVNQKYGKDLGWSTVRRYLVKEGVIDG